jgi:23S rRNA (guanosine2251-2'-O)-methyltransferase
MKDSECIFGIHPVIEALTSSQNIDKIFLHREIRPETRKEIMRLCSGLSIPVQFVPSEKLKRLVPSDNHQGVVALISPVVYSEIEPLVPWWFENGIEPLIVVADEVTDVRNFGAIARTAEGAGVHAIIVPHKHSAQINAQAVKASAGALYNIPLCRSKNLLATIQFLKQSGFRIVSVSEKSNDSYTNIEYRGPLAVVLGSEEYGISDNLLRISDNIVSIPMLGKVASLNVSVAAGIVLYEIVRQNKIQSGNNHH